MIGNPGVLIMTQNIIIVANLTKYIILLGVFFATKCINAQCWEERMVPDGYKRDTVYTLDSLMVSNKTLSILDHAIALVDSFNVNRKDTWLYFAICLNSRYDERDGTQVRIELKQGVDYDILRFYLFEDGKNFSGAFCYKGFTFFVLCKNDDVSIYKELFQKSAKSDFSVYYKSPAIIDKWKALNYPYMEKYVYLFYQYLNGKFYYSTTTFVE
jgi:hypothetical protein